MSVGLFAMLAGFLMPLALVARLGGLIVWERKRGFGHPLMLVLATELLLALTPVVALVPSVWSVATRQTIEAGAMLLDFAGTDWGLAKLAVSVAGVLVADLTLPRVYDQLVIDPASLARPTTRYHVRDLGVLAICLVLASIVAVHR